MRRPQSHPYLDSIWVLPASLPRGAHRTRSAKRHSEPSSWSRLTCRTRREEHLRQHLDVQPGLLRRRPAGLAVGHAAVEVLELAGEALAVELGDPDGVGPAVPFAPAVDGRALLEPGRGKGE